MSILVEHPDIGHAGRAEEREQSWPPALGQLRQPRRDKDAILLTQRGEVGDRADRDQIEELADVRFGEATRLEPAGLAQPGAQPGRHEERQADRAQPTEWIGRIGPVRIEKRQSRMVLAVGNLMVVHDDHVDAAGASGEDGRDVGRAAIEGDDQPAASVGEPQCLCLAEAVAGGALGDPGQHRRADRAEKDREEGRRGHAVNIVIAENTYGFTAAHRGDEAFLRLAKARHAHRRTKLAETRREEQPRLAGFGDAAGDQAARGHIVHAEVPHQALARRIVHIPQSPLVHARRLAGAYDIQRVTGRETARQPRALGRRSCISRHSPERWQIMSARQKRIAKSGTVPGVSAAHVIFSLS